MSRKRPNRGGRPPKLTPEVRSAIVTALGGGVKRNTAAGAAGISEASLSLWMTRGQELCEVFEAHETDLVAYAARGEKQAREVEMAAFSREARMAEARAKMLAELRIFNDAPAAWLRQTDPAWNPKNRLSIEPADQEKVDRTADEMLAAISAAADSSAKATAIRKMRDAVAGSES